MEMELIYFNSEENQLVMKDVKTKEITVWKIFIIKNL